MKAVPFILALFLTAATAGASVNPYDIVVQADGTSQTLILRTTTDVAQDTEVSIRDHRGHTLYSKSLTTGSFLNTRFALSALPTGDYDLVIQDRIGRTTQPVRVTGAGITADPAAARRVFFPQCDVQDGRTLRINYLNHRGQRVDIRVEDATGREVFSDFVNGSTPVQRAYELSRLPRGQYSVRITAKTIDTYTTTFELR